MAKRILDPEVVAEEYRRGLSAGEIGELHSVHRRSVLECMERHAIVTRSKDTAIRLSDDTGIRHRPKLSPGCHWRDIPLREFVERMVTGE